MRWRGGTEGLQGGAAAGRCLEGQEKGRGEQAPRITPLGGEDTPHGPGPLSARPCAHTSHNANHPVVRPRAERAKDGVQVSCPQRAVPERGRHRVTPEPRAPTFWADRAPSSLVCKWGENALRPGVARRLPQPGPTELHAAQRPRRLELTGNVEPQTPPQTCRILIFILIKFPGDTLHIKV